MYNFQIFESAFKSTYLFFLFELPKICPNPKPKHPIYTYQNGLRIILEHRETTSRSSSNIINYTKIKCERSRPNWNQAEWTNVQDYKEI